MKDMTEYRYRAFGLTLLSHFNIVQLPFTKSEAVDVTITEGDLSALTMEDGHVYTKDDSAYFLVPNVAKFRISDGNTIEVDRFPECSDEQLSVYLMGSCMGSVLHQRGYMPLHGSCVTDGVHSVLLTGDSGAGKSTLAAEFLSHDWKLLTDDVTAVTNVDEVPTVQPSYPSQKLWQDSLLRYTHKDTDIHSLYFENDREKFGVRVEEHFTDRLSPLSLVVRLIPTDTPCTVQEICGMTEADQLLRNTYRLCLISRSYRERHFRRCIALAKKVPMLIVTRQRGIQCAESLYEMITQYLGEKING